MSPLTLRIVTPEDVDKSIECDSVNLWMSGDSHEKGEGSIGIRKGHSDAVIALGKGPLTARQDGKTLFSGETEGGFAVVFKDKVTVVTPHLI
jgi:F0F1-type ATP synthase epsilon subunit